MTDIYFTEDLPDWGGSVKVSEDALTVESRMCIAARNNYPTISLTGQATGNNVVIPIRLIGLVV